jgi:hypothetical protein
MKKKDNKRVSNNNSIIKSFKDVIWVKEKDIELTCAFCPVQLEFTDINGMCYYYRSRHIAYKLYKSKSWATLFDVGCLVAGFDDGIITDYVEIFDMIRKDTSNQIDIRVLKGGLK